MADPSCTKCGAHEFEVTQISPRGSEVDVLLVHCTRCGAAVGVTEESDIGALLGDLASKVDDLDTRLGSIELQLKKILERLPR